MLRVLIKLDWQKIYDSKWTELKNLVWPILVRSEKTDNGYKNILIRWFEGNFVRLEEYSYHSEKLGKDLEWVNLVMDDDWEERQLRVGWNSISRSMINSLAGGDKELGKLNIRVYGNVKWEFTYPCISIRNNWERTEWYYGIDQQKSMIKTIETSKWNIKDYGEYETALKLLIPTINEKLADNKPF